MEASYIDLFIPRKHLRRDGVIGYLYSIYNIRYGLQRVVKPDTDIEDPRQISLF